MEKVAMADQSLNLDAPLVVSEIYTNCLYSGFFGRLDSERIKLVTDKMLEVTSANSYDYVIIDLSNIDIIDSAIAAQLAKIGTTLKLTGVEVIFCGIKSMVAQTMAVLGVEFEKFKVFQNLSKSLNFVYTSSGMELVPKK